MAGSFQRPDPLFDWFIPIDGDGAHIGTHRAERPPTFDYLRQVVETAEELGFNSLLIPTRFTNGLFDEGAPLAETWTTVTALGAVTDRIRFLVAVRPGFISTGLFAQMAATLDEITGGRLDINVVPGGIQGDYERMGDASSQGDRYARSEEFTVRVNCGTAIVGSCEQVACELLEYWRLGIDEFILSGYPHVEECRRVASDVLPLVRSLIRGEMDE